MCLLVSNVLGVVGDVLAVLDVLSWIATGSVCSKAAYHATDVSYRSDGMTDAQNVSSVLDRYFVVDKRCLVFICRSSFSCTLKTETEYARSIRDHRSGRL